jgi:hypothetical protein
MLPAILRVYVYGEAAMRGQVVAYARVSRLGKASPARASMRSARLWQHSPAPTG